MKSCGMNFIKYLLFIFNLIFAISGLGILIAGALVISDVSEFNHFIDGGLLGPPIVLIVAGAIVFVIAFLGCFGAIKESYNMLISFAVLLAIIFIIELAVGIAAAVYKSDFHHALNGTLRKSLENYSNDNDRIAWDNVQKKLMCCGINGPNDWEEKNIAIPFSCCHNNDNIDKEPDSYCIDSGTGKYRFKIGCYEQLKMKINSNAKILIGVGIGIAFIEVAGIFLACWLAQTIKKENSK